MTTPAHLTDEQFARYRNRTLTPVELLDLDSHLAACAACRDRLYAESRASAQIAAVRADISGHLDYQGTAACSEGLATPEQRQHLTVCAMCRAEVHDLSRFRAELQDTPRRPVALPVRRWKRWRVPLGIAAAVALIVGGTFTVGRRQPAPIASSQPLEAPLPAAERRMLDLALATRRFERAPVLDALVTAPRTLRGAPAESPRFELLAPLGTTVLDDHPVLRWTPLDGAASYVVAIFDERFEKLAESPALTATDWRPATPLPRGRVLVWQVTAKTRGGAVHAPAPPAPEAHFEIVPRETADRIEALRRSHPGNPLLLAVLYTQAGALDDAETSLHGLEPHVAQPYLESLAKFRKPQP